MVRVLRRRWRLYLWWWSNNFWIQCLNSRCFIHQFFTFPFSSYSMLLVHFSRSVFCALVVVLFSSLTLSAQDSTAVAPDSSLIDYSITAKNTVYAELAGNGGLYSVNYDRLVTRNISVRAGVSYWGFTYGDTPNSKLSTYSTTIECARSFV